MDTLVTVYEAALCTGSGEHIARILSILAFLVVLENLLNYWKRPER